MTCAQMSLDDVRVKGKRTDPMVGARDWIARNQEAWTFMVGQALQCADRGQRFGMKALAEVVRWRGRLADGTPYKLDNRIVSSLARILVAEHPSLKPYLEMRRSTNEPAGVPNAMPGD
jgi:hypothetical protein